MKRVVQVTAMLAALIATATTASAYRIEKVQASSPSLGKHYLYSCICDNGNRIISYSTSPINGNESLLMGNNQDMPRNQKLLDKA